MKPLTDLYPRITAFSNLLEAARRAQRGKRYRADVLAFNARLEANLFLLQRELRAFTYKPRRLPEQQPPGQRQYQHRRLPLLPPPPSTLHRQRRWKGFHPEHKKGQRPKGPDPLR